MKIALIGNGRMGQAIVPLAIAAGHTVTAVLASSDKPGEKGIVPDRIGNPDVAIEFTEPGAAVANALACLRAGLPVVVGTTGWYEQLPAVESEVRRANGALFWAPNFSLGIAVLSMAIETAMKAVNAFDLDTGVHLVETHHAAKKDKPSGTAAALADVAGRALGREVPITSVRVGHVPGTHELVMDARFDQLRFVHEARDRRVFAEGAIAAAKWLQGRSGVFTMKDVVGNSEDSR